MGRRDLIPGGTTFKDSGKYHLFDQNSEYQIQKKILPQTKKGLPTERAASRMRGNLMTPLL